MKYIRNIGIYQFGHTDNVKNIKSEKKIDNVRVV
jgi:hypothetical protein